MMEKLLISGQKTLSNFFSQVKKEFYEWSNLRKNEGVSFDDGIWLLLISNSKINEISNNQ